MKRDAIPGHEIDCIVDRIKRGESLEAIYGSLKHSIADIWFERNAEGLYKLAGVDPARDAAPPSIDDVLDEPEPTEATVTVDEVEHQGEPLSEEERKAALEELKKLEKDAQAEVDREPAARGKKHRR